MTEELTPEQKLELAGAIPVGDDKVLFEKCHLTVKDKHIVAECDDFEASKQLALLLSEEVFIRVKRPKTPAEVESLADKLSELPAPLASPVTES